MFHNKFSKSIFLFLIFSIIFSVSAQNKRSSSKKNAGKKTASTKAQTLIVNEIEAETGKTETKKNARPETETKSLSNEQTNEPKKNNSRPVVVKDNPVYYYEFSQPNFVVSKILVEHDENGKGKISILKKDFADLETDPLQLSTATMEKVKAVFQQLNFLDSTENYQFEKDYSHLGTMKFRMRKDGREREATFNYTDNKDAKALADEYRRIAQQFTWIFDINVARENQPLDAPRLFDSLDSLIRRNEVSDAAQMIPLLTELSNDERIPLIARNHSTKLIKQIEKSEKKNADKK